MLPLVNGLQLQKFISATTTGPNKKLIKLHTTLRALGEASAYTFLLIFTNEVFKNPKCRQFNGNCLTDLKNLIVLDLALVWLMLELKKIAAAILRFDTHQPMCTQQNYALFRCLLLLKYLKNEWYLIFC